MQVELSNPWMVAVYAIAMIAICWHFSYGIWLFAAKWGITPGKPPASASATSAWRWRLGSRSWALPASGPLLERQLPASSLSRSSGCQWRQASKLQGLRFPLPLCVPDSVL